MKSTSLKIALLVLSTVMILLLAEIFIRFIIPQQLIILRSDIWRPDSTFGYRHREHVNTVVNTGEGPVHFVTDGNGYRINQNIQKGSIKQPDISILTIGDSFLEALQIENEFTIPEVVRKNLEDRYTITVQSDNTGVMRWNPNHYYLEAKRALARKKYQLGIVFLFVQNDIIRDEHESFPAREAAVRHDFRIPKSFNWYEIIDATLYPVNDFLETKSHLFILARNALRIQLAKIGLTARYFPTIFMKDQQDLFRWSNTARLCKKIKDEFDKYDTPVFFVLLPAVYQVNDEIFYEYIESFGIDTESVDLLRPNGLLRKEFEMEGLTLVDPLAFMKNRAKNKLKMYNSVDGHFNEQGHQVVSEYIFPVVESYLMDETRGDEER
jgi:hypothetical protein